MRLCAVRGIDAVQRRRGADEAGAIFISVDRLDGRADLLGPAPQALLGENDGGRVFTPVLLEVQPSEIEERMRREVRFDPDLWWIAIDDREGRSLAETRSEPPAR